MAERIPIRGEAGETSARQYALMGVMIAVLVVLLLYPLALGISAAFEENGHFTTRWIAGALADHVFRGRILNSLLLACVVTLLANLIAFPLALLARHYDFRFKILWTTLILAPMIVPPFVGAIGMRKLFGTFGSFTVLLQHLHLVDPHEGINWLTGGTGGGFWILALLMALGLYPIAYLNLQASLANIDPAMLEAGQNLGGRRWRNFFRITLPLARPGIFAGSTLIFIWAFTELGTPLLLQYPHVVSRSIWDDVASTSEGRTSAGFAKVFILLVIAASAYILGKRIFGRAGHAMTSRATVGATTVSLGWRKGILASLPFAMVTFLALLPHIGVILYSFTAIAAEPGTGWGAPGQFGWYRTVIPDRYTLEGYRSVLQTPEIYQAILNSIQYAGVATLINIVLGIGIAWVLVRTRLRGKVALDALAMLPLAVPGLVMAFAFFALLLRMGLSDILRTGPFWVLVIAYSIRRLPYLVRSCAGGLEQTSITLEEAGANLGASPWRVVRTITLPLISANIIAGSLLTFAFAMLEVSDSLILAQVQAHYPITKMIYVLGNDMSGPANTRNACALGVLAMLFMGMVLLSAAMLMGKKLGALFRA